MSKFRLTITTVLATMLAALMLAVPALAAPVTLNSATTQIPVKLDVNAGLSYDLSGTTYEIGIAGKIYSGTLPTNVRQYPSTSTISNTPITINLGTTAPTSSTDTQKSWSANWTLAQLFGDDPTVNFPDAGMYEFDITASHTGDDAADWNYTLPSYKLQVLIKNNANMTGREYGGWVLTNDAGDKISNDDENDPSNPALFSATNKATGTLNVTKQVSGNYASTTHAFPQTITLTLPDWAKTAVITAKSPSGATLEGIASNEGVTRTYTASLAHNQTATFEDVPVGTRYSVVETTDSEGQAVDAANLKYDPSIQWSVDSSGGGSTSISRDEVSVYNGNTLVTTMTLSELKAASAAIAADTSWAENADKANNFASPNTDTTSGLYASYMKADYSFVFGDDPQATPMSYRIVALNHDIEHGEQGLTFMAKNALDLGYPFRDVSTPVEGVAELSDIVDTDGSFGTWSGVMPSITYNDEVYYQSKYSSNEYHSGTDYYPYIKLDNGVWKLVDHDENWTSIESTINVSMNAYTPISLKRVQYNGIEYIQGDSSNTYYKAAGSTSDRYGAHLFNNNGDWLLISRPEMSDAPGGWEASSIKTSLNTPNGALASLIPSSALSSARTVSKSYVSSYSDEYDYELQQYTMSIDSAWTDNKLWIPAFSELVGNNENPWYKDSEENTVYDFFAIQCINRELSSEDITLSGELGESSSSLTYNEKEFYYSHSPANDTFIYSSYPSSSITYSNGTWTLNDESSLSSILAQTRLTISGSAPSPAGIAQDSYGCGQACWTRTIGGDGCLRILPDGNVGSNADSISPVSAAGILPCFCL